MQAERGLELVGKEVYYGAWNEGWGRSAARALLSQHPDVDAIACGSDEIARGALDSLRDAGRSVPEDVSVIGHDNWEILAAHCRPPLSTIDMNLELVGREAAQLLFAAMEGNTSPGTHTIPTSLIPRESTAF